MVGNTWAEKIGFHLRYRNLLISQQIKKQRYGNVGSRRVFSFIQVKTPIQVMAPKIFKICIFSSAKPLWKHPHTSLGIPCLPWLLSSNNLPCSFPRCASLIVQLFLNPIMSITKINLFMTVSGQGPSMLQVLEERERSHKRRGQCV